MAETPRIAEEMAAIAAAPGANGVAGGSGRWAPSRRSCRDWAWACG
ncbi:MAG: hypothetical protein JKP98_25080 [Rhodobacteraceae bacterium]|nr:hypothetical protein [Paracoccaceae bacterium]